MAKPKTPGLVAPAYGTKTVRAAGTWGPDLADFMEQFGVTLLPWQRLVADQWLAHNAKGELLNKTAGLVVGRRNGKSLLLVSRMLFGMWFLGELRVNFTAQDHRTADEIFKLMCELVEDHAPELMHRKRLANGSQRLEIVAHDGKIARFTPGTRTESGARGTEATLLVMDEGMYLKPSHMAAQTPLVAKASASGRGQILIASSAGTEESEVLRQLRDRGRELNGKDGKGFCWHEWAAPEDCDVNDRTNWYLANPSLGTLLIDESFLASQQLLNSDEGFKREHLGAWGSTHALPAIDPREWTYQQALELTPIYEGEPCWMSLDMAFDKSAARLLLFTQLADGRVQMRTLEAIDSNAGLSEAGFIELVRHHAETLQPEQIAYDELSCGNIAKQLELDYRMVKLPVRKYATACAGLKTAVKESRIVHDGNAAMAVDIAKATARPFGDGSWLFDRRGGKEIPGAIAAALGYYLASDPDAADTAVAV